jgi:ADP-heptose:LPS heptosyltransferase
MKKLLIVRPDGIGDFVIFSGVLEEYRRVFREYEIHLLCHPTVHGLATSIPFLEKVICLDTGKLFRKRYLMYMAKNMVKILRHSYDTIIYPKYSRVRSDDLLVALIPGKNKIAFDGDNSNDPNNARFKRNRLFDKIIEGTRGEIPEIERNAEFINKLGGDIEGSSVKPRVWLPEALGSAADTVEKGCKIGDQEYLTVFPGAGDLIRQWGAAKWRKLITTITTEHPEVKIVILGRGQDAHVIEEIVNALSEIERQRVINLLNQSSLGSLVNIIKKAVLFVGSESSGVHIAAAVETPSICLMGGGYFGRFYPYGDLKKKIVVYRKMKCFGCKWRCNYGAPKCIENIEVEEVYAEIGNFFKKTR